METKKLTQEQINDERLEIDEAIETCDANLEILDRHVDKNKKAINANLTIKKKLIKKRKSLTI